MIAEVTCECGQKYTAHGTDEFDAQVQANRRRQACRDKDAERHRMLSEYGRMANRLQADLNPASDELEFMQARLLFAKRLRAEIEKRPSGERAPNPNATDMA